jgi:hypothetical protein
VAVDASGWIARAAHGQGTHLLDERTLTNYGRAELTGSVERGSNAAAADGQDGAAATAAAAAADQDAYDEALRQEYTQKCVITVMKRVLTLRDVCLADVLVVLDGASPPIKKETVGQRRGRRDAAVALETMVWPMMVMCSSHGRSPVSPIAFQPPNGRGQPRRKFSTKSSTP